MPGQAAFILPAHRSNGKCVLRPDLQGDASSSVFGKRVPCRLSSGHPPDKVESKATRQVISVCIAGNGGGYWLGWGLGYDGSAWMRHEFVVAKGTISRNQRLFPRWTESEQSAYGRREFPVPHIRWISAKMTNYGQPPHFKCLTWTLG